MARLILIFLILTSFSAWAQQEVYGPQPSYVADSHQKISSQVEELSNQIDALFGDKRTDDEANDSTLRLEQSYFWRDNENGSYDIQLNFNLKLRNLKLREEAIRESIQRQKDYDQEEFAPSGEVMPREKQKKTWEFVQESGVRFSLPMGYFAHGRVRRNIKYFGFINYFYQQVGWDSRDQWLATTSLNSDLALTSIWIFRVTNAIGWGMTNKTLATAHSASVLGALNKKSGLSFDARYYTVMDGRAMYEDFYTLGATYRYAFSNGWTFLEFTPDVSWKRQESFAGKTGLLLKVEAVFGGTKDNL